MAKTISVKVEGEADFGAVTANLRRTFSTAERQAEGAAGRVEAAFAGAGDRIGRALEIDAPFRGLATESASVAARIRSSLGGMTDGLGPELRGDLGDAEDALAALQRRVEQRTGAALAAIRADAQQLGPAMRTGVTRAVDQLDRLATEGPPPAARAMARIRSSINELPPDMRRAAGAMIREAERAGREIPPPFGRAATRSAEALDDLEGDSRRIGREIVDAFDDAARKIPGKFDGVAGDVKQRFSGLRSAVSSAAGFLIADVGQQAARSGFSFFKSTSEDAANLEDARDAAKAVFGDATAEANKFAEAAPKALGIGRTEALKAETQLGQTFRGIGLSEAESQKQAQALVERAADVASRTGANRADVLEAFMSAQRGEFDPAQKFAPLLTAAAVEQEAMKATGKSKKALTERDKVLARGNLLLKQTASYQGDFANTLDSTNNKVAIQQAEMGRLREEMGKYAIPLTLRMGEAQLTLARFAVDHALPALADLAGFLQRKFGPALAEVRGGIGEFVDGMRLGFTGGDVSRWQTAGVTIRSFFESLFTGKTQNEEATQVERFGLAIRHGFEWLVDHKDEILDGLGQLKDKTLELAPAGLTAFGAFKGLSSVVGILSSVGGLASGLGAAGGPITVGVVLTAATIGGLVLAYQHSEKFRDVVGELKTKVEEAAPKLQDFFSSLKLGDDAKAGLGTLESFLVLMGTIGVQVAASIPPIVDLLGQIGPALELASGPLQVFTPAMATLTGVFQTLTDLMNGDFRGAWEDFKTLVPNAIELVIRSVTPGIPWNSLLGDLESITGSILRQINKIIEGANQLPGVNLTPIALGSKRASTIKKPPKAATGHVAFNEQMLIVGDNRGASHDPELISPKSHIAAAVEAGVARALQSVDLGGHRGPVMNIGQVVTPPGRDMWAELEMARRLYSSVG